MTAPPAISRTRPGRLSLPALTTSAAAPAGVTSNAVTARLSAAGSTSRVDTSIPSGSSAPAPACQPDCWRSVTTTIRPCPRADHTGRRLQRGAVPGSAEAGLRAVDRGHCGVAAGARLRGHADAVVERHHPHQGVRRRGGDRFARRGAGALEHARMRHAERAVERHHRNRPARQAGRVDVRTGERRAPAAAAPRPAAQAAAIPAASGGAPRRSARAAGSAGR